MKLATTQDVITLFRPLSPSEAERAEALLDVVSDSLRLEAKNVGKDIDCMIAADATGVYANVVRSVVVDVISRMINTSTDETPLSQFSQSALGYTVSGTYLVPGGGVFFKKSELSRLGLKKQRLGVIRLD